MKTKVLSLLSILLIALGTSLIHGSANQSYEYSEKSLVLGRVMKTESKSKQAAERNQYQLALFEATLCCQQYKSPEALRNHFKACISSEQRAANIYSLKFGTSLVSCIGSASTIYWQTVGKAWWHARKYHSTAAKFLSPYRHNADAYTIGSGLSYKDKCLTAAVLGLGVGLAFSVYYAYTWPWTACNQSIEIINKQMHDNTASSILQEVILKKRITHANYNPHELRTRKDIVNIIHDAARNLPAQTRLQPALLLSPQDNNGLSKLYYLSTPPSPQPQSSHQWREVGLKQHVVVPVTEQEDEEDDAWMQAMVDNAPRDYLPPEIYHNRSNQHNDADECNYWNSFTGS